MAAERTPADGQQLVTEQAESQLPIRDFCRKKDLDCAPAFGMRDRDVQVSLAPSSSAQLMIPTLRSEMPRLSCCGRAVPFSGAQPGGPLWAEARPQ